MPDSPIPAAVPFIEHATPPAPVPVRAQAHIPVPSFRISQDAAVGDVLEVDDPDYTWTFEVKDPVRTSTLSPSPELPGVPSRRFVISAIDVSTSYALANHHKPPSPCPEDHIVKGQVLFFGGWSSGGPGGVRGDMRTGTVMALRLNGRQVF